MPTTDQSPLGVGPATPIEELTPRFSAPDLYQVGGPEVHLMYHPASTGGLPYLTYQDRHRTLQFRGDEVRRTELADLGTVISVTLVLSVDSGSTTFNVLLPRINLPDRSGASCPISCVAITAIHRSSPVPVFEEGPLQTYSCSPLFGTASLLIGASRTPE